jgi:hypothetical protein
MHEEQCYVYLVMKYDHVNQNGGIYHICMHVGFKNEPAGESS